MKAFEIQWDFDMDEVFEKLDETKPAEAAEFLGVPADRYDRMTTEERHDYADDVFRHCPALLDEFMDLPDEIEIPEGLSDPEDISDWLSDEYGFCHEGFKLKEEKPIWSDPGTLCPEYDETVIAILKTGERKAVYYEANEEEDRWIDVNERFWGTFQDEIAVDSIEKWAYIRDVRL